MKKNIQILLLIILLFASIAAWNRIQLQMAINFVPSASLAFPVVIGVLVGLILTIDRPRIKEKRLPRVIIGTLMIISSFYLSFFSVLTIPYSYQLATVFSLSLVGIILIMEGVIR